MGASTDRSTEGWLPQVCHCFVVLCRLAVNGPILYELLATSSEIPLLATANCRFISDLAHQKTRSDSLDLALRALSETTRLVFNNRNL